MILTRLWAVILAVLATACLAGMFMLSAGASGDFEDSDRESIRAITEAGVAALDAEIQMSPARLASPLGEDTEIQEAISRIGVDPEELEPGLYPLPQVVEEVTETHRNKYDVNTTLAVIDLTGKVVASNGVVARSIEGLVISDAYKGVAANESKLFAVLLEGELHVANVMPANDDGYRVVATEPIDIGAGSILRRVLGSSQPAALIRKGKIIGGVIGDQNLKDEIKELAAEHTKDAPVTGASKVFSVGEGLNRRIGSIGRLPGPSGEGPNGVVLVVISRSTAAAGQQDLGEALRDAQAKGVRLNWALLGSVLVISLALAIYLPSLEAAGPIRRLTSEFRAVSTGAQHQIFHDRYGGAAGQLARTAAGTIEALRQAFLAELEIDEEDVGGVPEPGPAKPRTARARRLTRAHENLKGGKTGAAAAASDIPAAPRKKTAPNTALPSEEPPADSTQQMPHRPNPPPTPVGFGGGEEGHTVPMARRDIPPPGKTAVPPPGKPDLPISEAKTTVRPPSAGKTAVPPPAKPPIPAPAPVAPPIAAPARGPSPMNAASGADDEAYYREVFEEFVQVKSDCGESTANLSFERFVAKLRKNARDLKASRPNIIDVKFTVYIKDGKAALKAKVVR